MYNFGMLNIKIDTEIYPTSQQKDGAAGGTCLNLENEIDTEYLYVF